MAKEKKLSKMTPAEIKANEALLKNKQSLARQKIAKNNADALKQINKLRGGGMGGMFGIKNR